MIRLRSFLMVAAFSFVMGVALAVCGLRFPDWRMFLLLSLFIVFGWVSRILGYAECKQMAQPIIEQLFALLDRTIAELERLGDCPDEH
jgi:hypothetical protein